MKFLICLGFLLAATAASAQGYTTTVDRAANSVTTGHGYTATTTQTSSSPNGRTYTTTITRAPGGYQPMGAGGYNPMGH